MKILVYEIYGIIKKPFSLLKEITFDVYLLSDNAKQIIYITSTSVGITPYFLERICSKDTVVTKTKRVYIWNLRKFVDRQDAVLVDIYKSFAHTLKDGFLIPERVNQVLDISGPMDEAIKLDSRGLKKLLKKVNKYKHEISNDHDALKFFYEKMYVPHIKSRYDVVENFISIKKLFMNGELIFITTDGERVSGALCEMKGDTYYFSKNGVLDEKFVKEGALVATYYFPMLRAKEINAKIVDLGGSRPFLLDGVLRHKNKWGAKICGNVRAQRFIYLKNVLFDQPFIYVDGDKFKIAIFSEEDKLIKEYANSGLEFNVVKLTK